MIEQIRRAALLGYKLTFSPNEATGGVSVSCREFPQRGPCSVAWIIPPEATEETVSEALKAMIDSLFETIERLPDMPKRKPPKERHDDCV